MKTSVEWLEDNLISEPYDEVHFKHNHECWEQAKKMERDQIEKALLNGLIHWDVDKPIEQYYNTTYENTK